MARYEIWVLIPLAKTRDMPSAKNPKKTVRKSTTSMEPRYWKDATNQEDADWGQRARLDEAAKLSNRHLGRQFYVRDRNTGTGERPAPEASIVGEGGRHG